MMKKFFLFLPILLLSVEPSIPDLPSPEAKTYFVYVNPGVTTFVPGFLDGKVTETNKVWGMPLTSGTYIKHRSATIHDRLQYTAPDVSLGVRTLSHHHVFDGGLGLAVNADFQVVYIQGSYLFFPVPSKGLYFGAGITGGCAVKGFPFPVPYLNVPVTAGYQFSSTRNVQFVQIQATPYGTGTVSYGFGF